MSNDFSHLEFREIRKYHENGPKFGVIYNKSTRREVEIMLEPTHVIGFALDFTIDLEDRITNYVDTCELVNECCRRFGLPIYNTEATIQRDIEVIKKADIEYQKETNGK